MDFILFELLDEHLLFEATLLDAHVNLKVIFFSRAFDKAGQRNKGKKLWTAVLRPVYSSLLIISFSLSFFRNTVLGLR